MPSSKECSSDVVRKEIALAIFDNGIPPRPSVLIEIDKEMNKEDPDFSFLARIISADVSLSAALLKITNSPYYGLDRKVRSVPEALLILGLRLTIQTIAAIELNKAFGKDEHLDRFWDESGTTARVAGWLAMKLRRNCPIRTEDAYTFALFHDCGIPLLLRPFPEYRLILGAANHDKSRLFTDIEDEEFGTNHAALGAELARSWCLPADMVEGIRHHHSLAQLSTCPISDTLAKSLPLIAMTLLAEHLVYLKLGIEKSYEWDKNGIEAMKYLNISEEHISALLAECHEPIAGYFG
jgi:HD-like signal output (HDOD) protein